MTGVGAPKVRHLSVTSWTSAALVTDLGASVKLGGSASNGWKGRIDIRGDVAQVFVIMDHQLSDFVSEHLKVK